MTCKRRNLPPTQWLFQPQPENLPSSTNLLNIGAKSFLNISSARSSRVSASDQWIENAPEVRNFHGFLSANPDLKDAFDSLDRLAAADLPVVIHGETGLRGSSV